MEGFSVFKDSKSTAAASVNEENHPSENDPAEEKKEFYRKLEVIIASLVLHCFLCDLWFELLYPMVSARRSFHFFMNLERCSFPEEV